MRLDEATAVVFSMMVDDLTSGMDSRERVRARLVKAMNVPVDPVRADALRRETWGLDDPNNADLMFDDEMEAVIG